MDISETATDGSSMNGVRSTERTRKELELIEKATEIAIEIYKPALKELGKR